MFGTATQITLLIFIFLRHFTDQEMKENCSRAQRTCVLLLSYNSLLANLKSANYRTQVKNSSLFLIAQLMVVTALGTPMVAAVCRVEAG